jgi:hypothetical protein
MKQKFRKTVALTATCISIGVATPNVARADNGMTVQVQQPSRSSWGGFGGNTAADIIAGVSMFLVFGRRRGRIVLERR